MIDYSKAKFIIPNILSYVEREKIVDSEVVGYFPERFSFSYEDFEVNFHFLTSLDLFRYSFSDDDYMRSYFEINGFKVILSTLCGQGCISFIQVPSPRKKLWKYKEKYSNKFTMEELEKRFPLFIEKRIEYEKTLRKTIRKAIKNGSLGKTIKKEKKK